MIQLEILRSVLLTMVVFAIIFISGYMAGDFQQRTQTKTKYCKDLYEFPSRYFDECISSPYEWEKPERLNILDDGL